MVIRLEPSENETTAITAFLTEIPNPAILEIGCGDGRLTYRYAAKARKVVAIDPNAEKIAQARQNLPSDLTQKVYLFVEGVEDFCSNASYRNMNHRFDTAIFSWSL